jgi:hypothetical protein
LQGQVAELDNVVGVLTGLTLGSGALSTGVAALTAISTATSTNAALQKSALIPYPAAGLSGINSTKTTTTYDANTIQNIASVVNNAIGSTTSSAVTVGNTNQATTINGYTLIPNLSFGNSSVTLNVVSTTSPSQITLSTPVSSSAIGVAISFSGSSVTSSGLGSGPFYIVSITGYILTISTSAGGTTYAGVNTVASYTTGNLTATFTIPSPIPSIVDNSSFSTTITQVTSNIIKLASLANIVVGTQIVITGSPAGTNFAQNNVYYVKIVYTGTSSISVSLLPNGNTGTVGGLGVASGLSIAITCYNLNTSTSTTSVASANALTSVQNYFTNELSQFAQNSLYFGTTAANALTVGNSANNTTINGNTVIFGNSQVVNSSAVNTCAYTGFPLVAIIALSTEIGVLSASTTVPLAQWRVPFKCTILGARVSLNYNDTNNAITFNLYTQSSTNAATTAGLSITSTPLLIPAGQYSTVSSGGTGAINASINPIVDDTVIAIYCTSYTGSTLTAAGAKMSIYYSYST